MGTNGETLNSDDMKQHYIKACAAAPVGAKVVVQNTQRVGPFVELFYTPVSINNIFQVQGMLDSGSMACTLSEKAEQKMLSDSLLTTPIPLTQEIVLVGCGGTQSKVKCMYKVKMKIYGETCLVPILVVPGQHDDLIIGTNVIRFLMHQLKITSECWCLSSSGSLPLECEQFLNLMSNPCQWRNGEPPDKIGTVKLQQSVTLLAKQEHLVWGKLPNNVPLLPGSTVIVEPTSSKSMPRNIMIGRVITPLWGDRWIPMKVTNLSDKPIYLRKTLNWRMCPPVWLWRNLRFSKAVTNLKTPNRRLKMDIPNPLILNSGCSRLGLLMLTLTTVMLAQ